MLLECKVTCENFKRCSEGSLEWCWMCLAQLVFLYCTVAFGWGGGVSLTHLCAAWFLQTHVRKYISPSSFSPFSTPLPSRLSHCLFSVPKKNLFNLLVYLGAVSLCPVVLSLLSHWLCASPPCVPVSHKSNPLQTPRHSVVYTSGWGTVSPGQGGNCEFSHGCWETNNRPSAAWQSPGLAASSWKKLRGPAGLLHRRKHTHTVNAWGFKHSRTHMHPSSIPHYLLKSGSQGSAAASPSCQRVKVGWHPGQVVSSSGPHRDKDRQLFPVTPTTKVSTRAATIHQHNLLSHYINSPKRKSMSRCFVLL